MLKRLWVEIPAEYRADFRDRMLSNNFKRLSYISVVILLLEVGVLLISERMYNVTSIVEVYVVFSLILVPLIRYVNGNMTDISRVKALLVQYVYILSAIWFCLAVVLSVINQVDLLHIYLMGVFSILIYVEMSPKSNIMLLIFVYLIFFFLLPNYLDNPAQLLTLRVNALVFNILVWIFARMMFKMRMEMFITNETIREKNDTLKDMASRDSMTGLYNHASAYKHLKYHVEEAKRKDQWLTIIMADIDNFKDINDTYGHQYGDSIIKSVSQVLNRCIRSTDIVCRYGGEEFLIILPGADYTESERLAERIRSNIESTEFSGGEFVTISGGVCAFSGESVEELVKTADLKLYEAKQSGKNRFVV